MLKDEYKVYEEKMKKSIESVANDFAAYPTIRQRSVSPARSGISGESRYGKLSGTIHVSFFSVTVPVLRGKP